MAHHHACRCGGTGWVGAGTRAEPLHPCLGSHAEQLTDTEPLAYRPPLPVHQRRQLWDVALLLHAAMIGYAAGSGQWLTHGVLPAILLVLCWVWRDADLADHGDHR